MKRTGGRMGKAANFEADRAVWRYCRSADAPADEAARFLDLAGFADDRLDEEDHDRVAALLAVDLAAAADVAAARELAMPSAVETLPAAVMAGIIARAEALVADGESAPARIFSLRAEPDRPVLQRFAQWGSLAAAIVVASWLGFAMGSDTSAVLTRPPAQTAQTADTNFLPELLDPTTSFLRELVEGRQT
ncbi:MAG TPA: hypothetical protein VMF05_12415 [Stellaceae bacterium]|nr:hypothetical protein [Stellaceae bacterium]